MDLDNLDRVTALRNHRAKGLELLRQAKSSMLIVTVGWDKLDAASVVCLDPIRAAIVKAAQDFIAEKEAELNALGVTIAPPEAS